jgi:L,D-transpeptidase catalytic domain
MLRTATGRRLDEARWWKAVAKCRTAYGTLIAVAAFLCGLGFAARAQTIQYHLERSSPVVRFSADRIAILQKLNHADAVYLTRLKFILVPDRWEADELAYSPIPRVVQELSEEDKAIVVDIATQVFGAYEWGKLIRWGPVSTGDRNHQTPPGAYHLNWHSRREVSTENPAWIMPWYFNFDSRQGLGLHQYTLPGRPASHGCVRLLAVDAQWLYHWGDGWAIDQESRELIHPGTLVLVIGKYDFRSPQPWLLPEWWSRGVTLLVRQTASR